MPCRVFFPVPLALLLCYCAAPSLDSRSLSRTADQATQVDLRTVSLAAFDEHVRPALSICTDCHGNAQAPLFMVEDTETAHNAAVGNVDFEDIGKSNFLKRILEQQHNCGDCTATGEKVQAALTKWQEARASAGNDDSLGNKTQQLSFPSRAQKMQWDIGKFIDAKYGGGPIMLSVRVQPDSDNGRYSLVNLNIYTDKIDIYIKGIKPLINDKWNSNNAAYKDIACAVKSTTQRPNGHIIHATGTSIVPNDFSASNKLSFAVAELRLATDDDPSCWSDDIHKDMFTHSIRPIIADNCEQADCHGTNPPTPDANDLSSYSAVKDLNDSIKAIIDGEKSDDNIHKTNPITLDTDEESQLMDWLAE